MIQALKIPSYPYGEFTVPTPEVVQSEVDAIIAKLRTSEKFRNLIWKRMKIIIDEVRSNITVSTEDGNGASTGTYNVRLSFSGWEVRLARVIEASAMQVKKFYSI